MLSSLIDSEQMRMQSTFRITYHNQFHRGSKTSWLEMLLKVPDVPWLQACVVFARRQESSIFAVVYLQLLRSDLLENVIL